MVCLWIVDRLFLLSLPAYNSLTANPQRPCCGLALDGWHRDPRQSFTMQLSPAQQQLRDRFFQTLLEATFPFQKGPDPEVTLELLIQAAQMLQEHLEQELAELRQEQAE